MKKIFSVLLAAILMFCSATVAFAAETDDKTVETEYPFILVRGMDFDGLTVDLGTENEHNALHSMTAGNVLAALVKCIGGAVQQGSFDGFFPPLIEYVEEIMGELACDNNGDSLYNTTMIEYPLAVSNYPELLNTVEAMPTGEISIMYAAAQRYGAENVYYFNYDWRLSPLDNADKLNEMIELAKADHNTDKVNLVCCSMGGAVTDAYIYEYGCESLNKCIFDSSAFCGTYVATDLFQGKVLITANGLEYLLYDMLGDGNFIVKALASTGILDSVADFAMKIVDSKKDYIYDAFLKDTFATMPALWAIVLPEEYDACIEYMFPTDEEKAEYAGLIAKADELQEMMRGMDDLLLTLPEKGVEVAVFAGYDSQPVPVYERASTHGDSVLESSLMLGRAKVANMGETLGDGYSGERVSPDNIVDLSDVLFPEYTWAFKNMPHVSASYGTQVGDFLFWLLEYDGQPTVDSNPDYPQFMISSSEEILVPFEQD